MKKIVVVVGILISIGALYFALKDIKFDEVAAAFGRIDPLWFAVGLVPWVVAIGSKVFRWRLLFYPDQAAAPYPRLTAALLIGYLFNTVLPLRTGEIVRATVLRATAGLPVARTLSTILVEKVLDTMALIAMLGLILPFISLPADFVGPARLAGVLFGGLFVVVLAAALLPDRARALINWGLRFVPARLRPAILGISNQVLDGLIPLRRREVAPGIVIWTVISWTANVLATYLFLGSFGLWLPFTAPALVVDATNLVMTVPSAPGYVGVYHVTAKQSLLVFGVEENIALAFATFLHAIGFLPLSLAGLISMIREGLSWGAVQAQAAAGPAESGPGVPSTGVAAPAKPGSRPPL
ncbi:MAG TPA: lysylphosphatidylglycerol synthase transmembrane domain-containing protein [Chloroflexia bacterium]|nr:lysylphosphatidylglycerol synthase transmembrane domain-containing protein [Chloroflexia bacterium]